MLGGFAHIAVMFNLIGAAFLLILTMVYRPKSRYVYEHAAQALGLWVTAWAVKLVIGLATGTMGIAFALNPFMLGRGALGGLLLAGMLFLAIGIALLVLVIVAAVKGFQGQPHRYPVIGDFVASLTR